MSSLCGASRHPLQPFYPERRTDVVSPRLLPGAPSVLVVDADHSIVDVFTRAIADLGIDVVAAHDGRGALDAVHRRVFNLWLLETKLPDLHGLDVVRLLRAEGLKTPFIVITGFATVQTAVEATRLGAWDVLEKPVRLDELRGTVHSAITSTNLDRLLVADPRTPCERWCNFVIRLVIAEHDLRSDAPWARHVGVSLSTLRDCCRRVMVKVEDARNFARALRAICHCGDYWTPETLLDIDDARTLKKFEERSGIRRGSSAGERHVGAPTIEQFFERQEWLPRENSAVGALRRLLMGGDDRRIMRQPDPFVVGTDAPRPSSSGIERLGG